MAERSAKRLGRLLRVRTLQLGQVQSQERAAAERRDSEAELQRRIASLAADVAPRTDQTGFAASLAAAAHYRERLHMTAEAAERRVAQAEAGLQRAQSATREARRDQSAIEKLIARAHAQELQKELRKLEESPPTRKRHNLC
jgi:flagellar FliJ protein